METNTEIKRSSEFFFKVDYFNRGVEYVEAVSYRSVEKPSDEKVIEHVIRNYNYEQKDKRHLSVTEITEREYYKILSNQQAIEKYNDSQRKERIAIGILLGGFLAPIFIGIPILGPLLNVVTWIAQFCALCFLIYNGIIKN